MGFVRPDGEKPVTSIEEAQRLAAEEDARLAAESAAAGGKVMVGGVLVKDNTNAGAADSAQEHGEEVAGASSPPAAPAPFDPPARSGETSDVAMTEDNKMNEEPKPEAMEAAQSVAVVRFVSLSLDEVVVLQRHRQEKSCYPRRAAVVEHLLFVKSRDEQVDRLLTWS